MIYPKFLKSGNTIGITAPSDGISDDIDSIRLDIAKSNFNKLNFNTFETTNCRTSNIGRSSSAQTRAKQLESLFLNPEIDFIWSLSGGDFLLEILPYLNLENIKNNPKWIQGFSDPTGILFTITTNLDIATIYGNNFKTFSMQPWHTSLENNLKIIQGNLITQNNFDLYESNRKEYLTGTEGYSLDTPVVLSTNIVKEEFTLKGRLIGGCIDILLNLVGTKFDKTKEFIEKYKNDGIIWYFDNCELTSENIIRGLWQLQQAGWFNNTTAIIFGRTMTSKSCYNVDFKDAILTSLSELNIPIIFDMDIGHVPPQITLINGCIATINYTNGLANITMELN